MPNDSAFRQTELLEPYHFMRLQLWLQIYVSLAIGKNYAALETTKVAEKRISNFFVKKNLCKS
jgi:hypothetical protein